jgi:hypothetical protein
MFESRQDEIIYWHKHIVEQEKSGNSVLRYCEKNGLPYKKFSNMKNRIKYSCQGNQELYNEYVKYARELKKSGMPIGRFCKLHDVDKYRLGEMVTHLSFKDVIESYQKPEQDKPMQFIQVPSVQGAVARPSIAVEAEVMKKQNDVELIISAGVKVVVAPEVGAHKLIRIIELLKDL